MSSPTTKIAKNVREIDRKSMNLGALQFSYFQLLSEGVTWLQAAGNWYLNRTGLQRVFDECGVNQSMSIINSGAVTEGTSCPLAKQCIPTSLSASPILAQPPSQPGSAPSAMPAPSSVTAPVTSAPPSMPTPPTKASNATTMFGVALSTSHLLFAAAVVCLL
jgi:hypothetical protein